MFKIVHRQIFRELAGNFVLTVACLLGLILVGRLLQMRDILLSQNIGAVDLALLFLYLSPFFLLLITPIATMLSVFLTFLRMSTDKELVALKANGVSLYQLVHAPLAFSALCMLLTFFISFWGLAWGMDNFKTTLMDLARTRTQVALQPGIFNKDFPGLIFHAQDVDKKDNTLHHVFVQDTTRQGATVNIVAPVGSVRADVEQEAIAVEFRNGSIYRREGEKLDVLHFGHYSVNLPLESLLGSISQFQGIQAKEMSVGELRRQSRDPAVWKQYGEHFVRKLKTELQKRYALPVGCFVLGFFAMPIACVFTGLRQQVGLVLSLGLFVVYYSLFSVTVSLGETGALPQAAVWAPNVLFLGIAAVGLRVASRERSVRLVAYIQHFLRRRRTAKEAV